ncbi:hypothetical protein ACQ4PT_057792 [Festuca glaucescens]
MAAQWLLLLLFVLAGGGGVVQVEGQLDNLGFISIDCGLPENAAGYVDSATKLRFISDASFIHSGTNHNMSAEYITPSMGRSWHNVRSFAAGARNCYTLRSLVGGLKYLIRATFMYGNYDGLNRSPLFDLHVGVNYWSTVNISDANTPAIYEVITVVPGGSLQVCLVNTGSGTPFISSLSLRPFKNGLYPMANATQGLVLVSRVNFGPSDGVVVRFPDDPHDRIWMPLSKPTEWSEISTTKKVQNMNVDSFEAPSAVMQTAITPINDTSPIEFSWDAQPNVNDPSPGYICVLHLSELQILSGNAVRQFYITVNGQFWDPRGFTPQYLYTNAAYNTDPNHQFHQYNVSLNATANSTLPPILNALEVFSVLSTTGITTAPSDVSAMTAVRDKYQLVKKDWMGDPCLPKNFAWKGLGCSYAVSSPAIVTGLNLSSSGLSGNMSPFFASLKGLQYLDLSRNNLTGTIPNNLSQLPALTLIDLTGNNLSGSIPSGLLKRIKDGSLTLRLVYDKHPHFPRVRTFKLYSNIIKIDQYHLLIFILSFVRYGNNPNICSDGNSCQILEKKKSSMVAIYVTVPIVAVAVMVGCLVSKGATSNNLMPRNRTSSVHRSLQVNNRRFTYNELVAVTSGFQRVIGQGGFGKVYDGFLEDGTQVAVKLLSESSDQGVPEFLAEAQILAKIHHKNLVSLIGYCKDREYMALVYEYMSEGALHEHLRGTKLHATCYGVVLVEIVTGQPHIPNDPEPTGIILWVRRRLVSGNIEGIVDARMCGDHDVNSVWKVTDTALKCTSQTPEERPTMTNVVALLKECLELEAAHVVSNAGYYTTESGANPNSNAI